MQSRRYTWLATLNPWQWALATVAICLLVTALLVICINAYTLAHCRP